MKKWRVFIFRPILIWQTITFWILLVSFFHILNEFVSLTYDGAIKWYGCFEIRYHWNQGLIVLLTISENVHVIHYTIYCLLSREYITHFHWVLILLNWGWDNHLICSSSRFYLGGSINWAQFRETHYNLSDIGRTAVLLVFEERHWIKGNFIIRTIHL